VSFQSKIGLGSAQFGSPYGISNTSGQTPPTEVKYILQLARELGITIIDTASSYGNSEKILGENNLSQFKLVSKFMPPLSNDSLHKQLKFSLEQLNLQKLYGYLAHRPMHLAKSPEAWFQLEEIKQSGLVDKIGFSLYEPIELEILLDKGFIPDLVQVPFSYFDNRFSPYFVDLKKMGCEIHTRSVFLQGLFFVDTSRLNPFFNEVKSIIASLQRNKQHLAGMLLKYVLVNKFVDCVILGIENALQLSENNRSLEKAELLPPLQHKVSPNILIPSQWPSQ
jgi:aryl-alcohol dehydrogenase-like predicted oxidoreductase